MTIALIVGISERSRTIVVKQYTTANERGAVNGFKRIYPEDLHFFTMALRTACA
jgi:hypothetical protein